MVLQRLNQAHHNLEGEQALPPLEPPHSVNGPEMFEFLSPSIIQDIEALDPNHQCVEYWNYKLTLKEGCLKNILEMPVISGNSRDAEKYFFGSNFTEGETKAIVFGINLIMQEQDNSTTSNNNSLDEDLLSLRGLPKKANPEELKIMHRILCSESRSPEWRATLTTLTKEIQRTCK